MTWVIGRIWHGTLNTNGVANWLDIGAGYWKGLTWLVFWLMCFKVVLFSYPVHSDLIGDWRDGTVYWVQCVSCVLGNAFYVMCSVYCVPDSVYGVMRTG